MTIAMHGERGLIEELLRHVWEVSGIDYRQFAQSSLRRRLWRRVRAEGVDGIGALHELLLADPGALTRLHREVAVSAITPFRRPSFLLALRERVIPVLRTYPSVSVWCVSCGAGEQAYATAILLREEGMAERARIYATDADESVLALARSGVYPLATFRDEEDRYRASGGRSVLAEYYVAQGDTAVVRPALRDAIVFAQHNAATDASFHEFQLILCRDAMIYWQPSLQQRTLSLFHQSLCRLGILGIGARESLDRHPNVGCYEPLDAEERLFRRLR